MAEVHQEYLEHTLQRQYYVQEDHLVQLYQTVQSYHRLEFHDSYAEIKVFGIFYSIIFPIKGFLPLITIKTLFSSSGYVYEILVSHCGYMVIVSLLGHMIHNDIFIGESGGDLPFQHCGVLCFPVFHGRGKLIEVHHDHR